MLVPDYTRPETPEERLMRLLQTEPHNFKIDHYHLTYTPSGDSIWIANAPYADLTINGYRMNFWHRRKIRKLIKNMIKIQVTNDLDNLFIVKQQVQTQNQNDLGGWYKMSK